MIRNSIFRVGLLTVALFAVMTAMCGWTSSCGTALHRASVATDAIANNLKTASTLNHDLYDKGVIDLEDRQMVATYIVQATQANDVLIAQLSQAAASGSPVTVSSVLDAFDKFVVQIDVLEQDGVLHLKSAAAQERFKEVTGLIRIQIAALRAILAMTNGENQTPQTGGALLFAAVLTPSELEALIALALGAFGEGATLVQKLLAMKGKTDIELLADAAEADAAAREQARADMGPS